jgi:hypothetical protein
MKQLTVYTLIALYMRDNSHRTIYQIILILITIMSISTFLMHLIIRPLPLEARSKFALEQAMKAQRESRGIALLFL